MLIRNITEAIGRTPLLEIPASAHGMRHIRLYAKLEHLNPFGSLKDRAAFNILGSQLEQAKVEGRTVIESSSGNMAKAMQVLCGMHGVPFRVVTSKIAVREVKQVLQLLGAEVTEFPGMSSCPDPSDPNNPIAYIEREVAANPGKYLHTTQFTNTLNSGAHYEHTGPEIAEDLDGKVDIFVGGMGTTGSSRGTSEYLRTLNANLVTIGVVAKKGHPVPGIRNADEMFEVGLFKKELYSSISEIDVDQAIDGIVGLIRIGVLAGPTSGGAFSAALTELRAMDAALPDDAEPQNAVFIVNDRVEWYLSYLQKYRPELFGMQRKESARTVEQIVVDASPQVAVDEVEVWLKASKGSTLVVDTRGALAFKAGHIAGSINLPTDQLEELCEWGTIFSKGQRVLFVCPIGAQSRRFAAFFSKRGVDCASLAGGFIAWRDGGKPIQKALTKTALKK